MPRTANRTDLIIRTADDITSTWLGQVMGDSGVELAGVEPIGTGQMSLTCRASYRDGTGRMSSVVVKLASSDERSRATGVGMSAYLREISFYQSLADRISGPTPQCHLAEYDHTEGWFTLVLEDHDGGEVGDQLAGCDADRAHLAMTALAQLHAPVFNDTATGTLDFLNIPVPMNQAMLTALLPQFFERYSGRIDSEHMEICRRYVEVADAHAVDIRGPVGLVHGDFRLDNLIFGSQPPCVVVDWQPTHWGSAMSDAAYFLGGNLQPALRRAHEKDLLRHYYDTLESKGVKNFDWDTCWQDYRRQTFRALAMIIGAAMVVERTPRGDDMFMTWLQRTCCQIADLGALDLLPEPGSAPPPLPVDGADEAPHNPGLEKVWNESWYFDAVSASGDAALYVRLGSVPNMDGGVYSVAVVRPGRPTIMITDYCSPRADLQPARQSVTADNYRATHDCVEPLAHYRIALQATGQSHSHDANPLHEMAGTDVQLHLDLDWRTNGAPYRWRAASRYEIPCQVDGTITIDDEEFTFSGAGQRDHSWGTRDWWSNDWMWTAFRLNDGTRLHAVTVAELPGVAVGYIQNGGHVTEELSQGRSQYTQDPDNLIAQASLILGKESLEIAVEPLGFGNLRMQAPDGRLSHFVRAAARFTTTDGRTGLGWIEWNINQKPTLQRR